MAGIGDVGEPSSCTTATGASGARTAGSVLPTVLPHYVEFSTGVVDVNLRSGNDVQGVWFMDEITLRGLLFCVLVMW